MVGTTQRQGGIRTQEPAGGEYMEKNTRVTVSLLQVYYTCWLETSVGEGELADEPSSSRSTDGFLS